jgi:hypothetical protein
LLPPSSACLPRRRCWRTSSWARVCPSTHHPLTDVTPSHGARRRPGALWVVRCVFPVVTGVGASRRTCTAQRDDRVFIVSQGTSKAITTSALPAVLHPRPEPGARRHAAMLGTSTPSTR